MASWQKLIPILFLSFFPLAYATQGDSLEKLFTAEEKAMYKQKGNTFVPKDSRVRNYPLYPYLEQKFLLKKRSLKRKDQIKKFLQKYEGTPLDWPLRKKWLQYLSKRNEKQLFIDFYKQTSNAELNCFKLRYQLDLKKPPKDIWQQVEKLWIAGKSQPKACDPLFSQWTKKGYRTEDVIYERIKLVATKGKHTLIPYLTMLLPKQQQYIGRLWHRVRRDPSYVRRLSRFPLKNDREVEVLTYGIKRLVWKSPDAAVKTYELAKRSFKFSTYQKSDIIKRFAIALASKKHKGAHYWLGQVEDKDLNDAVVQWRIADALRKMDWNTVKSELERLPDELVKGLQWQYWLARSYQETGQTALAKSIYKQLAKRRHYYGFLSAGQLKQEVSLDHQPVQVKDVELKALSQHDAWQRAFAMHKLSRFTQARREWNYWMSQLTEEQKLIAAKLAFQQKWYDRAIFTLADVGYLNDIDLRFPVAYQRDFERYSKQNKINPAWAFAISRRESAFMVDAHSHAGAHGLMQVLPSTARYVNKRKVSKRNLLKARTNISLGTKYLKYLLGKHDDNNVLATAAYNAGSHRVKRWLKKQDNIAADVWIETIPYKETRDYVKSVLAYQQIYQLKAGNNHALFDDLAEMEIGE